MTFRSTHVTPLITVAVVAGTLLGSTGAAIGGGSVVQPASVRLAAAAQRPLTLHEPSFMAIDRQNNVYAGEVGGNALIKLSPTGKLTIVHRFALDPNGNGNRGIWGVALDTQNNIYVGNRNNDTIVKLSPHGTVLATWGGSGSRPGQIDWPQEIAIDRQNHVYVADFNNSRIEKFSSSGKLLSVWGSNGTGPGQFDGIVGVAVDRQGDVWATDHRNARIEKFSPTGKVLAMWGTPGSGAGQFDHPNGIAVDAHGAVYVQDGGNNRLQKLLPGHKTFAVWLDETTIPGTNANNVDNHAVAVDGVGNVYIAAAGGGDNIVKLSPSGHILAVWR
jgi:streptogramin lyase